MKKSILLVLFACFCVLLATAQDEEYTEEFIEEETESIKYPMFIGATFQTLLPQSTFGEKMTQPGYGGQLSFLINLNQTSFYAGFESSIANFGNEVFDFTDNQGFDLKWKTNSILWNSHIKLRFEPRMVFPVQPYLSGQIGFNHFFTATRLVDPESDDNPLERYVDDKSWSLSYGGSFGLLIPLDKKWLTMLDLRATYLRGGDSSFYTKRQDNFTISEDSLEAFDLEESPIDMLGLSIGLLFFIE